MSFVIESTTMTGYSCHPRQFEVPIRIQDPNQDGMRILFYPDLLFRIGSRSANPNLSPFNCEP